MNKVTYKVGSTIRYSTFSGEDRTIVVEGKEDDIKNGRPGFDGTEVGTGLGVWGYDDQIVSVVKL